MKKLYFAAGLFLLLACNERENDNPGNSSATAPAPRPIGYSVINTYPHDTSSFTQGLVVYKGSLYEGTGEYGHSKLLKVDLTTGKIEKQIPLEGKFFGEGITILRDSIYQLTWQEHLVFVYTLPDFKKVKEFKLDTQGWGITDNGKELIVSDGIVREARFKGDGCAISLAAASILTELIVNVRIDRDELISNEAILSALKSDIKPARIKCALLALDVLRSGVEVYRRSQAGR